MSSSAPVSTGDGTVIRLTGTTGNEAGGVFTSATRSVSAGFSTSFNFRLTSSGGITDATGADGADGLAFVVQRSGASAVGATGEGIGYLGIGNSIAVEFDTFLNTNRGDPNSNHVGVNTAGSVNSAATANVTPAFDNGTKWTAWVDYNGSVLEVRVSQNGIRPASPLLSHSIDIATTIGGSTAFIGFTAATGAAYSNHDLLGWAFSEKFLASGLTIFSWSGSGAWSDTARWNPAAIPGVSDIALVSSGVANVTDTRSVGTLQFSGGTLGGSGTLTLTDAGSIWSGGSMTGTGTLKLAAGATLEISGNSAKIYNRADGNGSDGRKIENFGTISWTGSGNLQGGDGGQILNQTGGLFDLKSDATLAYTGGGNTPLFSNAGTFRKSAGTGTSAVSNTAFVNSGLVDVQTGTLSFAAGVTSNAGTFNSATGTSLLFSGGQTFNTGTTFTGTGTTRIDGGTTTVAGALSSQNLTFANGVLQGTAGFTGSLAWTGGAWSGTGTLTMGIGSALNISGSANKVFNRADGNGSGGRIIENFGTTTWTGSGQLLGGDGAQIINRTGATFLVQNSSTLGYNGGGLQPLFLNQGTLRKTTDTGTTTFSSLTFENSGQVDVQVGTLAFTGGVTSNGGSFLATPNSNITFSGGQTFNTGTSLTGPDGKIRILGGPTTVSGALVSSGVEFAGGDLYGTASISGTMAWSAGTWRGASTVSFAPGSTLTLAGAADKALVRGDGNGSGGRILSTAGTLVWNDTGRIIGNDGAGIDILSGGLFEIRNNSTFLYGGGGNVPFLTNAGTVRKFASGGATVLEGVAFTNTGKLEIQGGTLSFTSHAGLANNGVVEVQAGSLTSSATGMTSTGGTFLVFGGASLSYTGGTNTINNSAFNGAGLTEVAGGTLLVSSSTVGGNFRLSSGAVGGSGGFTVNSGGSFAWAGGNLTGTGTLAIASGGTLTIEGTAQKSLYRGDGNGSGGRQITSAGTTTWSGSGSILGGDGASFSNLAGGLFLAQSDATFGYTGGGNGPTFTNAGIFRKTGAAGVTLLSLPVFNSGTIESQAGTVRLSGGGSGNGQFLTNGGAIDFATSYTLGDGARFLGATFSKLTGGALHVPSLATATVGGTGVGRFALEGGVFDGAGVFLVGASGGMNWSAGSLAGTGTLRIAVGGELNLLGNVNHDFYRGDGNGSGGRNIENLGTLNWIAGDIRGGDGAHLSNAAGATFDIAGSGTFGFTGGGNAPTFANAGTVQKSGGGVTTFSQTAITTSGLFQVNAGTLHFSSSLTSNGGSFVAGPGTTLTFSGGQAFNTGTSFTGTGLTQATAGATTLTGTITASRFILAGGSLYGTATVNGLLEWSGGDMRGASTLGISAGSTLLLTGVGDRNFFRGDGNGSGGRVIENFGSLFVENSGDFLGGDGAQIINRTGGLLEFRNDQVLGFTGGGNAPTLLNEGILRKANGSGTTTIANTGVTQNGLVQVAKGTLHFASGVTSNAGQFMVNSGSVLQFSGGQTFNTGTQILGPGLARATAGTTVLSGNVTLINFELAGGSLHGTSTLTSGLLKWTGGDMAGTGTLTIGPGASLFVSGAGNRLLLRGDGNGSGGRTIENRGLMVVDNSGNLLGNDGAQIVNRVGGIVDLRNDASIAHGGGGNVPTFTNEGTLAKSAGTGTSTIAIPFVNTGNIVISSGSLVFTSAFTNSGGSMTLANGGSFTTSGTLDLGTAPLSGTGTITAATVTAGGLVSPGSSPGTLTITGNLTLLNTSNTLIELNGSNQGVDYDFLSVGGSGALAGNLQLSFLNGFHWTMPANSTFTVLTAAGGLTGAFANVAPGQRLIIADGTGSLQVNYGTGSLFAANSVVLSNFIPIPEPSTYALLGIGTLLVVFARYRQRR